ncbi:MAG TPA: ATP-binding protein, partial [Mycobacteriales bacterium]|nr:ATP-binding protein [Mycobacteriales bacterium]
AHHISMINVQAGVALHLMDERPEQARTALTAIKQASRESLGELRSVLELLRQGDEAAPRTPAPGLDALETLSSRAAAAGLPVRVEVSGTPRRLPAAVDLAAYRIVQEALTNVARHAGRATADVRLEYGDDELVVQVDDDGAVPAPAGRSTAGGTGSGLLGMAERASALDGEVEAGPRAGGGFRVRARLPLPPDAEPTGSDDAEETGTWRPTSVEGPVQAGAGPLSTAVARPAERAEAAQPAPVRAGQPSTAAAAEYPAEDGDLAEATPPEEADPSVEVGGRDRGDA